MKTKPMWKLGDPVELWSDSRNNYCRKEYGVVIAMHWDRKQQCWDCRVMFFGTKWPRYDEFRDAEPYILWYLETSLRPYKPQKQHVCVTHSGDEQVTCDDPKCPKKTKRRKKS